MPRPDEGLIHAWLDGQLPPEEAARIEELATTDPEWAAAVAEARGLVAASSRILSALDRVPAGVVPKGAAARTGQRLPWWTKIAAAVVVVVGGSVVVMQNVSDVGMPTKSTEQRSPRPIVQTEAAPQAKAPAPVALAQASASAKPAATAQVPAPAPAAGAPAGAGIGRGNVPALRREALTVSPVTPPSTPAPSANAIVAEERKVAQGADRAVAELSAAKSLVAKAAPSTAPTAAPSTAPTAAPLAQQASTQELARAQNALPAQRVMGGIAAARIAQGQQATLCYRLVADSSRAGVAVIMRAVRTVGDTLHLVPVEPGASQQAWLVLRDGMRGVMTTRGDLRSTTHVVGTPATCPAP